MSSNACLNYAAPPTHPAHPAPLTPRPPTYLPFPPPPRLLLPSLLLIVEVLEGRCMPKPPLPSRPSRNSVLPSPPTVHCSPLDHSTLQFQRVHCRLPLPPDCFRDLLASSPHLLRAAPCFPFEGQCFKSPMHASTTLPRTPALPLRACPLSPHNFACSDSKFVSTSPSVVDLTVS